MFGALSALFAHAAASVVCFWGILLCYFTFRVLGQPALNRLMDATILHRALVKQRLPALHGVDLGKRADDTPVTHIVRAKSALVAIDMRDLPSGEILGTSGSETWTHRSGLHRVVLKNPLLENVRHLHLLGDRCGLRSDGLRGMVVIAGNAVLPADIEAAIVRRSAVGTALKACQQPAYDRPGELDRAWNLLCEIAQMGAPTTLHALHRALHPRHVLDFDALQWSAVAAGVAGPVAFLWGLSIITR